MWLAAELHLVHVFRSASFDRPASAGIRHEDLVAEAKSHLDYQLRMARRQCPSGVVGHFAEGDPVDEIVRCARQISADLLIVGTHDTFGLERLLLGSVATKLSHKAPCSVVVIRQKVRPYTKVS
jgi:nucleotide-binding universal stress UspA family protein